jgi:IS30 family transposase
MSHLTQEQRYTIAQMKTKGYSQKEIASTIDKNKSVISRELKRNSNKRTGEYDDELAQSKYEKRMKEKPKKKRLNEQMKEEIQEYLSIQYSPEQIAGYCEKEGIEMVSVSTIYEYIWEDKRKKGNLYLHLRSQGKRYRKRGSSKDKRGQIKNRVDISKRPLIVESKERFGDLEIDTIIGKDHQGAIVTINDRATGMLKMKRLQGKEASQLAEAVIEILSPWKSQLQTITADNGKEFAEHEKISQALGIDFYFAKPYHSWERGANENLNGLIRQYIPKKTDFKTLDDDYIAFVEDTLNQRPRKRYKFLSPIEMFHKKVAFVT